MVGPYAHLSSRVTKNAILECQTSYMQTHVVQISILMRFISLLSALRTIGVADK